MPGQTMPTHSGGTVCCYLTSFGLPGVASCNQRLCNVSRSTKTDYSKSGLPPDQVLTCKVITDISKHFSKQSRVYNLVLDNKPIWESRYWISMQKSCIGNMLWILSHENRAITHSEDTNKFYTNKSEPSCIAPKHVHALLRATDLQKS